VTKEGTMIYFARKYEILIVAGVDEQPAFDVLRLDAEVQHGGLKVALGFLDRVLTVDVPD
jgi:hypothetical protein